MPQTSLHRTMIGSPGNVLPRLPSSRVQRRPATLAVISAMLLLQAVSAQQTLGGAAYDAARRQTEQAKRAADSAQSRWTQASNVSQQAERAVDQARSRGRDLPRKLEDARRKAADRRADADRAEQDVQKFRAEADRKSAEASEAKGREAAARQSLSQDERRLQESRSGAMTRLQNDDGFQQAMRALLQAERDLHARSLVVVEGLAQVPAYRALEHEASVLEARLKAQRELGPRADNLPEASKAWMVAHGKVLAARADAIDADPEARQAKANVATAKDVLRGMQVQLDAQAANDPAVLRATEDIARSRREVETAASTYRSASSAADSARSKLSNEQRRVIDARADARRIDDDIARLQREQASLDRDIADADRRAADARNEERRAATERDRALAQYRAALDNEARARREDERRNPGRK